MAVNALEIRAVGMSRSGNHAVLEWIQGQIPGRVCFLNCAEPKTNPFVTARPLPDGRVAHASYDDFDLAAERAGRFGPKDALVHSYEDCFLGMLASPVFERHHDAWVGSSARRVDLLILRDPFNLLASRWRAGYGLVSTQTALRIWRQHARELLRPGRSLPHDPVAVRFDAWVRDREARRRLAAHLGIPFSDAGHQRVARGGASSFDGHAYDGSAGRMAIEERWRQEDPAALREALDETTLRLAREIFGWTPFDGDAPRRPGHGEPTDLAS